jgi:predicted ferric reductase
MDKDNILRNTGWWIIIALSLIPVLFILPGLSFSVSRIGDILGLTGFSMFAVVIILSGRIKFIEKFFNGVNDGYTAHHFFGGLAFVLLLFHPLLLAYDYLLVSVQAAAIFLLPSADWTQTFGTIALAVMIATLVITFYMKIRYQVWKFSHKFMGLAFGFAFFHVFFIGGDISLNNGLKIYLFVLSLIAIIIYLYRSLFSSFLVKTYRYVVEDIKPFEDKIWEVSLKPAHGKAIKFKPGQFAFVKFSSKVLSREAHPFSFSSFDGESLKIAIKEAGDYTKKVGGLTKGDTADIEGPFGIFSFKNIKNENQIWIAGGVGITPFLSMLRSLGEKDRDYKIDFYFSVKDKSCLAFKDEIESIARINKNLNVIFWTTDTNGFISAEKIKSQTTSLMQRDILICGPGVMMSTLKKQFLNLGFEKGNLHTEEFKLY